MKAIIFDFDGTLADTIAALREGINRTMCLYGYPEHTDDEIRSFINYGARELVRRALPRELQSDEAHLDRVYSDYNRIYGEVYLHTDRTYDGVAELVARLHGSYRIGVLSNKQDVYVKRLCEQILPAGSYDVAQGVILGKPTKPDPFLSHIVANALGVSPSECVMIGDSDVDFRTAQNAGMQHIGVTWGYRDEAFLRAHGVTLLAHTPDELEVLLGG